MSDDSKNTKQRKIPLFWGLHAKPSGLVAKILAIIPLLLLSTIYIYNSSEDNKFFPTVGQIYESGVELATQVDEDEEVILLWHDTKVSVIRVGQSLGSAAIVALFLGIFMGTFPGLSALLQNSIAFASIIPIMAILPILLMIFGVDEMGKFVLIFMGTAFYMTLEIFKETQRLPHEQKMKALTLDASPLQYVFQIVLPQMMPRLLAILSNVGGVAWLLLIAAEMISAESGLGYRIFINRRYLAMPPIYVYATWIGILGLAFYQLPLYINKVRYSWYMDTKK